MSRFYYFVSKNQLPTHVIERAHSIYHSLDDVTGYVNNARNGYHYYNCDPVSIYISDTRGIDGRNYEKILAFRQSQESNYLIWLTEEFNRLGDFEFIRVCEDNTKCEKGNHEAFFKKCKHQRMSYMDFCWCLASNEKGLEDDVLYIIY